MPTLTDIPQEAFDNWDLEIAYVADLDEHGADCPTCDHEAAHVQLQFYAINRDGDRVMGHCCPDCLHDALCQMEADPTIAVHVEILPETS